MSILSESKNRQDELRYLNLISLQRVSTFGIGFGNYPEDDLKGLAFPSFRIRNLKHGIE
jgi:hypothetical protein